jgi:hypothetical protein
MASREALEARIAENVAERSAAAARVRALDDEYERLRVAWLAARRAPRKAKK